MPVVSHRTRAALFFGLYEAAEARTISRYLRPNANVLELGASIGAISCLIASRLEPGRLLFCVEANSLLLNLLRANLSEYARHIDWRCLHAAISYAASDEVTLQVGATSLESRVTVSSTAEGISVPARRLGAVVSTLPKDRPWTLVSDIEGVEVEVLLNESELPGCEQIIAEFHTVERRGVLYTPTDLINLAQDRFGFYLEAKHGSVVCLVR
jgi:FkbM family methyltransferase